MALLKAGPPMPPEPTFEEIRALRILAAADGPVRGAVFTSEAVPWVQFHAATQLTRRALARQLPVQGTNPAYVEWEISPAGAEYAARLDAEEAAV